LIHGFLLDLIFNQYERKQEKLPCHVHDIDTTLYFSLSEYHENHSYNPFIQTYTKQNASNRADAVSQHPAWN